MTKKENVQTALLREILDELRRLNTNLERRVASPEISGREAIDNSEDMDEFE